RDKLVTGVQTCALPISGRRLTVASPVVMMPSWVPGLVVIVDAGTVSIRGERFAIPMARLAVRAQRVANVPTTRACLKAGDMRFKIGRASCRERVEVGVG